jgi:hypothetical protein
MPETLLAQFSYLLKKRRIILSMKKYLMVAALCVLGFGGAAQTAKDFFDMADKFLAKQVKNGSVNYKAIAADRTALDALVAMAGVKQKFTSTGEEKAFYLNVYNIMVIKGILNAYPVKGPLAIDGFFDKKTFLVNGASVTLNQLENDIVRKKFNDARIHFALVCGALSCPPLPSYAYKPALLDAQLENLTRQSIQNSSFTRVDYNKKTAAISMIFNWYKEDFIKAKGSVEAFLNAYLKNPLPAGTAIMHYEYNWALNGK